MKRRASIPRDEAMVRRLRKNPDFAAEYLKAALEDEPHLLLIALRHLAQAQAIAKVAKAGLERESLYRALSANGNPRLFTLFAVAKAVGLKLTVEAGLRNGPSNIPRRAAQPCGFSLDGAANRIIPLDPLGQEVEPKAPARRPVD